MRILWKLIGALAIVAVFFFGTLYVTDYFDRLPAAQAKSLRAALEGYRLAHGSYPLLATSDNPVSELRRALVGEGFLKDIPGIRQPAAPNRYVSGDGKSYGLLIYLDQTKGDVPGNRCLIEVGISNTGWWGQPPACKF